MTISTLDNEKELLTQAALGDEAAFTQLFYAYHNKLGAYIFRMVGSREIAEEIVQDVFVRIWTKRAALATVNRFGPYLYVLSRNHTLNHLRQLAGEQMKSREAVRFLNESSQANEAAEPVQDYFLLIDKAVDALPPQQHKVYILSRRERMKYDEIALRLKISRETVKKYLKLATRFITGYVRAHGHLLPVILLIFL